MSPDGARAVFTAVSTLVAALLRHLAALLLAGACAGVAAGELSEIEKLGKRIYLEGRSASGVELTAMVGSSSVPLPATVSPCASCHGADGIGRPEGGVVPSDIRWSRLTTPYGAASPGGRRAHPAYDETTLARAVRTGVDPAGNRLDVAMPRFPIPDEDMAALVAYLKRLETDLDPGIDDDRLVIATVVPRTGPMAAGGDAVVAVLEAWRAEVNEHGGIYGRKVELRVARAGSADESLDLAARFARSGEVFAMLAAFTDGVDARFAQLLEDSGLPLVGPVTQSAPGDAGRRRFTFYLMSGRETQGRALVQFATGRLPDPGIQSVVVHRDEEPFRAVALAIEAQARGRVEAERIGYARGGLDAAGLAATLKARGVQAVYFAGVPAELASILAAADAVGWTPFLFLDGASVGPVAVAAPARFQGHLYLAYPTGPSDQSPDGRAEFAAFRDRHALPPQFVAIQIAAYASAKVFAHALENAGRALSRAKLVEALEGMYQYSTGLTPPLTFGPNRRIGARGAHVVAVDPVLGRFAAGSSWVESR